jgi:FdhE protein
LSGAEKIGSEQEGPPKGSQSLGAPPPLRLPPRQSPFTKRAARFRRLAESHASLVGYLALMADLADVQHGLWEHCLQIPLPNSYLGRLPLDFSSSHRDPAWREALRLIAERLASGSEPVAALCERIRQATDQELESWATCLLSANFQGIDPGLAPFVAAALQVNWTSSAARLDLSMFGAMESSGHRCPVCGSWPVASVLQTGGSVQGLRYLCCSLCSTEWNRPRIHCIHCGSSKDVSYFGLEGAGEAAKAEACAGCKTYVKLMNREKEPFVDPFADDLATLGLDILMAEEGYERLGFNPLLIPGS